MKRILFTILASIQPKLGAEPLPMEKVLAEKIVSAEILSQRLTEVWQFGEDIDTVQQGVQIFRFILDPEKFSLLKPNAEERRERGGCTYACGPNYGFLVINGKHRFSLPCGFNEKSDSLLVVQGSKGTKCRAIRFGAIGKGLVLSAKVLPLTPENQAPFKALLRK